MEPADEEAASATTRRGRRAESRRPLTSGARPSDEAAEPKGWRNWLGQLMAAASLDIGEERERQAQRKGEVKPVNFGRILRELQHERVLFATALAFSLVTSAVGQLTPWLMGRLLDSLNTEGAEFATAIELLLGMLGVSLFSGLFGFLQRNVFTYISQSAVKRLRERVHFNVRSSLSNSDPQQVMLRTLQCAHAPLLS